MWSVVLSDIQVGMDKDRFVINLEVKHFNPDELSVKASDDEYEHTRGKRKEQKVSTFTVEQLCLLHYF